VTSRRFGGIDPHRSGSARFVLTITTSCSMLVTADPAGEMFAGYYGSGCRAAPYRRLSPGWPARITMPPARSG